MSTKENNPNQNCDGKVISLEEYRQNKKNEIIAFGMTRKEILEIRDDILRWDREQGGCEEDSE